MMLFSSTRFGLRKLRQKKPTAFCLPGFHADPVGQRTQAESIEQMISLVRQYLLACRADPYYGVYLSEIDYLKPYLDLFPEERVWITRLIQQERCATGGAYNQPNETTISGESLIRNLLIGRHYHKTLTGYEAPVYMTWDVFGHIPQLPQILAGCGIEAVVFTRTNYRDPSIQVPGIPDLYQWFAPNGSPVYARRISYGLPENTSIEEYSRQRMEILSKEFPNLNVELVIDAADMKTPRTAIVGCCRELSEEDPALIVTGAAAAKYFSCVHTLATGKKLKLEPVTRDISQYNEGCELSRMDLKQANRLLENRLFEAEIWGSIASLSGVPYPSEALDYSWRQLLFCQQHTGITGYGTDIVYIDLLDIYRDALEQAHRSLHSVLEGLSNHIAVPPERSNNSVLLFNSLPWLRDGLIQHWIDVEGEIEPIELVDEEGESIPYELERAEQKTDGTVSRMLAIWTENHLPATGYARRDFIKREDNHIPFLLETQSQPWIENEHLRVEIDPTRGGGIVSIVDKETGKEFINTEHAYPANNVILLHEGQGDDPVARLLTTGEKIAGSATHAEVKSLNGPISSRLVIRAQGPGPCIRIQEIRLYKGSPFIDCLTILENYRGNDKQAHSNQSALLRDLYVLAFPLDLPGTLPIQEDRFYVKAYRRSRKNLEFRSSFQKLDSEHGMNSCYRWVDVSWSLLCRFMNGKEEMSNLAIGPAEVVTARDRFPDLRQRLIMYLARHGVTCTPRYDMDDTSSDDLFRDCTFSIGTAEENAYINNLLQQNTKAREYYERKMAEFGSVILAVSDLRNGRNRPVFIFAGKTESLTVQAVDEVMQSTIAHRWECPHAACFLSELSIVEDHGFAFLNRGNSLCSLEADGTLTVALMHTAPYCSPQTSWPFDFAEQKNHIFQYRLYPHTGDWRHAEIPRKAMEYNHEPIAMPVTPHEGSLPPHASLLSIEPNNILISCLKPAGFPEAEYASTQKMKPPFIVRMVETHGEESNIWLESSRPVKTVKAVRIDEQPLAKKREVFREEQFIRTVAHANEILSLQIELPVETKNSLRPNPATESPKSIVSSRYWRHNSGAAPQGFLPLSLSLRGAINSRYPREETTVHAMELVLVNNSTQETFTGSAEILTPSYWKAIPSRIPYRLEGGSYQIVPFQLLQEEANRDGFIKARTVQGDLEIEDLIHVGALPEFDIAMTLRRESFNIKLINENPYSLSGSARLITPIEAWPARIAGDYSLTSFSPRQQNFSLEPGKESTLVFPLSDPPNRFGVSPDHHWMIVKMETHNCLRYYHVRMDGRPSLGLGRLIYPPYEPGKSEEL